MTILRPLLFSFILGCVSVTAQEDIHITLDSYGPLGSFSIHINKSMTKIRVAMEVMVADRVLDSDERKGLDSRIQRLATFMQKDITQEQKRLVVSEFRKYKRQFEIYRMDSLNFSLSESLEYGNAIDALVKRSTFDEIIPDTRIILDGRSISVSIRDPKGDTFELSVHNPDKYYEPEIYRVLKSTFALFRELKPELGIDEFIVCPY